MKLYLSSYKVGNKTEELRKWIIEHGNKICLIPNSRDIYPEGERKSNGIQADVNELTDLGFDVTVISLKDYFKNREGLLSRLEEFNAFYVIGGNTYVYLQKIYMG